MQKRFNPLDRGNLNQIEFKYYVVDRYNGFNPLDRGNLNQMTRSMQVLRAANTCFNPLDRGNLNQIDILPDDKTLEQTWQSFNPLDRGNLNQIQHMRKFYRR